MAPTMPSIMPLGATMSAPARAWLTHCRAKIRQRRVVVDVEPAGRLADDAAMAVIGVFAETFIRNQQARSRTAPGQRRSACWTMPSSSRRWSLWRPCERGCRTA